jgi:hypothetical protein
VLVALDLAGLGLGRALLAQRELGGLVVTGLDRHHRAALPLGGLGLVLLEVGVELLGRGLVRDQLGERLLAAVLELGDRDLELLRRVDRSVGPARHALLDSREDAHGGHPSVPCGGRPRRRAPFATAISR